MRKTKDILIIIFTFLVVFAIGFVLIGIYVIQDKYDGNTELSELNSNKKIESPIVGKWKVINSNVEPFQIISNGKKLYLNTIFEFLENGKHRVYETNKSEFFSSVSYRIDGQKLVMIDLDMVFNYGIENLTSDSLKLNIRKIPTYFWTDENLSDQKVKDKVSELQKSGVILELIKIKNGG